MPRARSFMFAIFALIAMKSSFAQEIAVTGQEHTATPVAKEYSDVEYRISSALRDETIVDVREMPLSKLLLELSDMHEIRITVDQQACNELKISPDQPVTFAAKQVPLGVAIGRLADKLKLSYVVRDRALLLTSKKTAARDRRMKVIMIPKTLENQGDRIIHDVTRSIEPRIWKSRGGNCEITVDGTKVTVVGNESLFQGVGSFLDRMSDDAAKTETNTE